MNTFLTIANGITLIRIGLTPILALLMLRQCWLGATMCAVVMMLTDWADGFVARIMHQQTVIGAVLDHAADKVLMITFFILALVMHAPQLPAWFCWFILAKECVLLLGAVLLLCGRCMPTLAPLLMGKVTMAAQMGLIVWWLSAQAGMITFAVWPVLLVTGLNGVLLTLYTIEYGAVLWR